MDGNGMAAGELTDADVFGAQQPQAAPQAVGQPGNGTVVDAPSGTPLNAAQTAFYAGLLKSGQFDPKTLPPHQVTEGEEPSSGAYVDLNGQLRQPGMPAPATAAPNAPAAPKEMTDADVFGAAGPPVAAAPAAAVDGRPVSQALGFAEGVNNVPKNILQMASGNIPGLPDFPALKVASFMSPGNLMTLPMQIGEKAVDTALKGQESTYRPGLKGKVAGSILASAPFAVDAEAPAVMGGIQGLLTSDSPDLAGKLKDAGLGVIGGKVGDMALGAISKAVMPTIRPAAQWAADNLIRTTPGQILGGPMSGIEKILSKTTLAGPVVRAAQSRTVQDFNLATMNNALRPAGLSLPAGMTAGHDAVDATHQALSGAYNAIVPKLNVFTDQPFGDALAAIRSGAGDLDESYGRRLNKVIDEKVMPKFDPQTGSMPGAQMKDVDSYLGQQARKFSKSQDPNQQDYGSAISDLQGALRDATERSNPQYADQLGAINNGWAQLVRIEKAANLATNRGGVFTPDDLLSAVKSTDTSVRGNAMARGQAFLQDWANQAKAIVPNKMPANGSLIEHLPEMAVTLGVGKESGLHGVGTMLAGEAAAGAAYTRPAQAAIRALLTQRPAGAKNVANILENLRPLLGYAGATGAPAAFPAIQQAATPLLQQLGMVQP